MYTKLASQLYSVRDFMGDEQAVRETFKRLAEFGYTGGQPAAQLRHIVQGQNIPKHIGNMSKYGGFYSGL